MKGYIDHTAIKPLYDGEKGYFCYIYDKVIKLAEKENKYLRITVPSGVMVITPKKWMKGAKLMEKVFKLPIPMKLWGNWVTPSKGYEYVIGEDGIARKI